MAKVRPAHPIYHSGHVYFFRLYESKPLSKFILNNALGWMRWNSENQEKINFKFCPLIVKLFSYVYDWNMRLNVFKITPK